jgi:hypothetical protein
MSLVATPTESLEQLSGSQRSNSNEQLPAYAPPPPRIRPGTTLRINSALVEHRLELLNRNAHPWLVLKLSSNAATPTSRPLYFQGATVSGSVELSLPKEESLYGITVTLRGTLATTLDQPVLGHRPGNILNLSQTLWTHQSPDINDPQSHKVQGNYSWPFSFTFPKDCLLNGVRYALPPSFSMNGFPALLDYRVEVAVKRGMWLPKALLGTNVAYIPRSRPGLPSYLRRVSDTEGQPLVGPEGDPEGWHSLQCLETTGRLFDNRGVEVTCILSLSKPLTYARGSIIPYHVTLRSTDIQALDLFSSPSSICTFLEQETVLGSDGSVGGVKSGANSISDVAGTGKSWASKEGAVADGVRHLHGEIRIRRDARMSSDFPALPIRHTVHLVLQAPGFVPDTVVHTRQPSWSDSSSTSESSGTHFTLSDSTSRVLPTISCPVTIVTDRSLGPQHHPRAPPEYFEDVEEDGRSLTAISINLGWLTQNRNLVGNRVGKAVRRTGFM